jgi:large subunit ribosomal protein L17
MAMRHRKNKKILDRKRGARQALFLGLTKAIVEHEHLSTTFAKAKAMRPVIERLITRGKNPTLASRRSLMAFFREDERPVKKILEVLAPRYKDRLGGYTRITKMEERKGDGGSMARVEFL